MVMNKASEHDADGWRRFCAAPGWVFAMNGGRSGNVPFFRMTRSLSKKRTLAIALLWVSLGAQAASAKRHEVAIALHLKVLSYDRNLKARGGDKLVVGVMYKTGVSRSEKAMRQIVASLVRTSKKTTVQGLKVTVVRVPYDSDATLLDRIDKSGATAIILSPGLESWATAITRITNGRRVPTLSFSREFALRGASVSVVAKGRTPAIVVNLKASRTAGMQLSSQVLRLAEVIK